MGQSAHVWRWYHGRRSRSTRITWRQWVETCWQARLLLLHHSPSTSIEAQRFSSRSSLVADQQLWLYFVGLSVTKPTSGFGGRSLLRRMLRIQSLIQWGRFPSIPGRPVSTAGPPHRRHWTVTHTARVETQPAFDGVNSIQECPTIMPLGNSPSPFQYSGARRCISERPASFASSRLAMGNQHHNQNQAILDIITIKML